MRYLFGGLIHGGVYFQNFEGQLWEEITFGPLNLSPHFVFNIVIS